MQGLIQDVFGTNNLILSTNSKAYSKSHQKGKLYLLSDEKGFEFVTREPNSRCTGCFKKIARIVKWL